jgi:hypothetical protein
MPELVEAVVNEVRSRAKIKPWIELNRNVGQERSSGFKLDPHHPSCSKYTHVNAKGYKKEKRIPRNRARAKGVSWTQKEFMS